MRIINAAYKEFARHGYQKASTNRIVKDAGIGKGMLFYYFDSKLGLYNFLLDNTISFYEEFIGRFDENQIDFDFIEKYRTASKTILEAYWKNPHILEFSAKLFFNKEDIHISDGTKKRYDKIMAIRDRLFASFGKNIDFSKFRNGIDPQKQIQYISWCLDGYTQNLMDKMKGQDLSRIDLEPYWAEFDEILDDLKIIFYESKN